MIAACPTPPYRIAPPLDGDRDALAKRTLAHCKAAILPLLATAGIARVTIEYNGEGDEGQIHDIQAFDAQSRPIDLPAVDCEQHLLQYGGSVDVSVVALVDALENFADTALEALHDGWENGDGAFGEVEIDVALGTATLTHNSRYISTDTSEHAL